MNEDLMLGNLVKLTPPNWESDHDIYADWCYHTAFKRLSSAGPVKVLSKEQTQPWMQGEIADSLDLMIRLVDDNRLIGRVGLEDFYQYPGNAWMSIEIGDPKDWNGGYGTEATRLMLRYGFYILNLRRVSLAVFAFNQRAIHLYEKFGFVEEGREREWLERTGERSDLVYMGLIREEWVDA